MNRANCKLSNYIFSYQVRLFSNLQIQSNFYIFFSQQDYGEDRPVAVPRILQFYVTE